jgi:hypothetical protein
MKHEYCAEIQTSFILFVFVSHFRGTKAQRYLHFNMNIYLMFFQYEKQHYKSENNQLIIMFSRLREVPESVTPVTRVIAALPGPQAPPAPRGPLPRWCGWETDRWSNRWPDPQDRGGPWGCRAPRDPRGPMESL